MPAEAVMILRLADGSLYSEASDTVVPLLAAAKAARVSGVHEGMRVASGKVIADTTAAMYQFRCEQSKPAVAPEPDNQPRKRRA
jgi:hypothetical protein